MKVAKKIIITASVVILILGVVSAALLFSGFTSLLPDHFYLDGSDLIGLFQIFSGLIGIVYGIAAFGIALQIIAVLWAAYGIAYVIRRLILWKNKKSN